MQTLKIFYECIVHFQIDCRIVVLLFNHLVSFVVFNYGSTHDVVQVTQSEYESCTLASSDNTYSMGPTNVTLTQIGTTYYICSVPNHCSNGMKLSVTAIAPSTSFDSSSSTTIPSSNSSSYFGTITPSSSTPNSSASLQLPTFSLVAILLLAFSFISFT